MRIPSVFTFFVLRYCISLYYVDIVESPDKMLAKCFRELLDNTVTLWMIGKVLCFVFFLLSHCIPHIAVGK